MWKNLWWIDFAKYFLFERIRQKIDFWIRLVELIVKTSCKKYFLKNVHPLYFLHIVHELFSSYLNFERILKTIFEKHFDRILMILKEIFENNLKE